MSVPKPVSCLLQIGVSDSRCQLRYNPNDDGNLLMYGNNEAFV